MKTHVLIFAVCAASSLLSGCVAVGSRSFDKKTPCGEIHDKGYYLDFIHRSTDYNLPCPGEQPKPTAQYVPQEDAAPPQEYAETPQIVVPAPAAYPYYPQTSYSCPVYAYRWVWGGSCYVQQRYVHHYEPYRRPNYHSPPQYYRAPQYYHAPQRYYVLPPTPTIRYAQPSSPRYYVNPGQPHVRVAPPAYRGWHR